MGRLRLECGGARRSGQAAHSTGFLVTAAMTQRDRWIVLKFGGTSVSRRERWDTIGRLARERAGAGDARVLVVVSALSGTTNELQAACQGDDTVGRVARLEAGHRQFA